MATTACKPGTRTPLSREERTRLEALLKVAAESPFPGERANALDAARRLAGRHGMSLQEATRPAAAAMRPTRLPCRAGRFDARDVADFVAYSEAKLRADKERYERALREAFERGLDDGMRARARASQPDASQRPRGRCRSPQSFAKVLLSETSLPLGEIVSLTGLDIYRIGGLKLKMRPAA
ncbi:MAG: hypothetical protein OXP07_18975 [Defluviicoccus sp.]|nr:hypothetical protein [Defluviicoccus sp.]